MALTSAGLPNGGLSGNGHYRFQYDDSSVSSDKSDRTGACPHASRNECV